MWESFQRRYRRPLAGRVGALVPAGLAVLMASFCFLASVVPASTQRKGTMILTDAKGAEHELVLEFDWHLSYPFAPRVFVRLGMERWQAHSGGPGYADFVHALVSPTNAEAVVAYQFEGATKVFVKFDLESETGIQERGYSGDYVDKGWKWADWVHQK